MDIQELEINSKVSHILTNLKSAIDKLNDNFTTARDLILELARYMNEQRLCETDQICIFIKKLLEDKIKERKISARWIENCLADEYKRKYSKSEESSLLRAEINTGPQTSLLQQVEKDNDIGSNFSNERTSGFRSEENQIMKVAKLEQKIVELEEALLQCSKFKAAGELEQVFQISKVKQTELNAAFEDCKEVILVKFDVNGRLRSINPDALESNEDGRIDDSVNDNDR